MRFRFFIPFVICLLLAGAPSLRAQDVGIGLSAALVSPNGDLGQYIKKSPGYSIFLYELNDEETVKTTFGLMYTKSTARMDTVPTYAVQQSGNGTTVLPGYTAYGKFNMYYINACVSRRVVHFSDVVQHNQLAFFLGGGVVAGISHLDYVRSVETVSLETSNSDYYIGGLLAAASIDYTIKDMFIISLEERANFMVVTDWSSNYTHSTFSLSATYIF